MVPDCYLYKFGLEYVLQLATMRAREIINRELVTNAIIVDTFQLTESQLDAVYTLCDMHELDIKTML